MAPAKFVGGQVCAGCHQTQAELWRGSHHDRAMQEANEYTVLGDFADASLIHFGVTSTFSRKNGDYVVTTEGPDGKPHDYTVAYTFGVYPLQQYLTAFPGGRYQALPFGWDTRPKEEGGQRWFHLYPNDQITTGDPLHWTGMNFTWNYMCADCHSTNLRRNFDISSNSYKTSWTDINVACEGCHGPGSRHVVWAKSADAAKPGYAGKGLVTELRDGDRGRWLLAEGADTASRAEPRASHAEIETCAFCHTRRREITDVFAYGRPLLDSAIPSLLSAGVYFPDGQIQEEDYEYGSFIQSRMFAAGVTCSNCHEPHSLKLRASGNQVCAQCHRPAKFDRTAHHHHEPGSAGAQCVNCHMPSRTYMVVDTRRDHAIRVPRPDLSVAIGTPNACTACHDKQPAQWAADRVAEWYGPTRRAEPHYGTTIEAGRKEEPGGEAPLAALVLDGGQPGIARATALSLLPTYAANLGPQQITAYRKGLLDDDPLVRVAAIDALAFLQPAHRVPLVAPLLDDNIRAVRIAAARSLAAASPGLGSAQKASFERAAAELVASEKASAESPESQVSLGAFEAARGDAAAAEAAYHTALRLDPRFAPAMVNLADLYRSTGRDADAETLLRQAIVAQPGYAPGFHALGLLLVRKHDVARAVDALGKAAGLAPDNERFAYVYGVALNSVGRPKDAVAVLEEAGKRHPAGVDILVALATISRDMGDRSAAVSYAERLVKVAPNNRPARALLEGLRIR